MSSPIEILEQTAKRAAFSLLHLQISRYGGIDAMIARREELSAIPFENLDQGQRLELSDLDSLRNKAFGLIATPVGQALTNWILTKK